MIDINDYKVTYHKKIKKINRIWMLILIFIIIGIIYINNNFKYDKYYSNKGEYQDDYLKIYVSLDDLNKITENKKIKIKEKEFAYKIKEISIDNIFMNNNYYKEVTLDIESTDLNNNEVVDIKIIIESFSLLEYVYKTIWR